MWGRLRERVGLREYIRTIGVGLTDSIDNETVADEIPSYGGMYLIIVTFLSYLSYKFE